MSREEKSLRLLRIIMRGEKSIIAALQKDIRQKGLTWKEFTVLEFLYNRGQHTIQEICNKLDMANSSLTYILDKLEEKDYLVRQFDPKDRRISNVSITQEGKQLMDDVFPEHVKTIMEIFAPLSEKDLDDVSEGLKKAGMNATEFLN